VHPHYDQAVAPQGRSDVVAIAAGACHGLALKRDATVQKWGLVWQTVPSDPTTAAAIAGGFNPSLARRSNGMMAAWGINSRGNATRLTN
jgi:alpha-tubulin suppressor-like RCC1 family protein